MISTASFSADTEQFIRDMLGHYCADWTSTLVDIWALPETDLPRDFQPSMLEPIR